MKKEGTTQSISQVEEQVARKLMPTIGPYLMLIGETYTLAGKVIKSGFPETNVRLSKQVLTKLLMRLSNDLRAIGMLANVGYDLQANAVAASVYECAFTMAAIADSDEEAEVWLAWDNPKKTYKPARELTEIGLNAIGKPAWVDNFYRIYSQLCWGKHLNPISERQGGIQRDGSTIDYLPGPRADDLTERGVCFCSAHACLLAFIGLQIYIERHSLAPHKRELVAALNSLAAAQYELYKRGVERWGSEDPFPGKW